VLRGGGGKEDNCPRAPKFCKSKGAPNMPPVAQIVGKRRELLDTVLFEV